MDAFLFDLDGTLIDSFQDIAASVNHARATVGLPARPAAEIYPFIGEGAQRLIERALGEENANCVREALDAWRAHYSVHMLDRTRPYSGIREALGELHGPKAVLTNKPGPSARRLVQELALSQFFPVVIGPDDSGARKPDCAGVKLALSHLPRCDRAVLVGDSAIDALTANNAGTGFVGVLWGLGKRKEMAAAGARIFAASPPELPQACAQALLGSRLAG